MIILKIVTLAIFFALVCRKDKDEETNEYIDPNNLDLDDEDLHQTKKVCLKRNNCKVESLFTYRSQVRAECLNEAEVEFARRERLKEIQMWKILHEMFIYICFIVLLSMIIYSNEQTNSFDQVKHLKRYFLNTRQIDNNYLKVCFCFFSFKIKKIFV